MRHGGDYYYYDDNDDDALQGVAHGTVEVMAGACRALAATLRRYTSLTQPPGGRHACRPPGEEGGREGGRGRAVLQARRKGGGGREGGKVYAPDWRFSINHIYLPINKFTY